MGRNPNLLGFYTSVAKSSMPLSTKYLLFQNWPKVGYFYIGWNSLIFQCNLSLNTLFFWIKSETSSVWKQYKDLLWMKWVKSQWKLYIAFHSMLNIVNYRGYIWDSVLGCQCLFIPTTACKYLLCTRHTVYSSKKKKEKKKIKILAFMSHIIFKREIYR